jgi:hypothetical protein
MRLVLLLVLLTIMSDRSATATFTSDQSEQTIAPFSFCFALFALPKGN